MKKVFDFNFWGSKSDDSSDRAYLPKELQVHILSFLDKPIDLAQFALVKKSKCCINK